MKPLWVRLLGENRPLSAGTSHEISCEVVGARPVPEITWTKGSTILRNTRQTAENDGNVTTSVLTFVPNIEDAGKFLTCKGSVPDIPGSELENGWKLDIHRKHYSPLLYTRNCVFFLFDLLHTSLFHSLDT